jgi:hypothetical protein
MCSTDKGDPAMMMTKETELLKAQTQFEEMVEFLRRLDARRERRYVSIFGALAIPRRVYPNYSRPLAYRHGGWCGP